MKCKDNEIELLKTYVVADSILNSDVLLTNTCIGMYIYFKYTNRGRYRDEISLNVEEYNKSDLAAKMSDITAKANVRTFIDVFDPSDIRFSDNLEFKIEYTIRPIKRVVNVKWPNVDSNNKVPLDILIKYFRDMLVKIKIATRAELGDDKILFRNAILKNHFKENFLKDINIINNISDVLSYDIYCNLQEYIHGYNKSFQLIFTNINNIEYIENLGNIKIKMRNNKDNETLDISISTAYYRVFYKKFCLNDDDIYMYDSEVIISISKNQGIDLSKKDIVKLVKKALNDLRVKTIDQLGGTNSNVQS